VAAAVTGAGESASSGGSFAEESARLLAALQEWAAKGRAAASDLTAGLETGLETGLEGAGHSPECSVCPICQAIRLVRGVRPEVVEHLSDAATSFLSALSALVATQPEEASARRPRGERAQHIDVTGEDAG
jgi:hypothetical protein